MRSQILDSVSSPSSSKNVRSLYAKPMTIEETLVVDERAFRRPAEAVEEKLHRMLQGSWIGVSQLRLQSLLSGRMKKA